MLESGCPRTPEREYNLEGSVTSDSKVYATLCKKWSKNIETTEVIVRLGDSSIMPGVISVADFIRETRDDNSSPTTSNFVNRIPQCKETVNRLEEVRPDKMIQTSEISRR